MSKFTSLIHPAGDAFTLRMCTVCEQIAVDEMKHECPGHPPPRKPPTVATANAAKRKSTPVTTGFLWYFPKAIRAAARVSKQGNAQHNPGQPLHWAKEKSTDHEDCAGRHLMDHSLNPIDTDNMPHLAKAFWRAGAALETWLETPEGEAWFEAECGK